MSRIHPVYVITYRDAEGNTYSEISRDVDKDVATLNRTQPSATILCVDRQTGYWTMGMYFKSLEEAYRVARGNTNSTLEEYYLAWEHLHTMNARLSESDQAYLEKLIDDGSVITKDNKDELGGVRQYPQSCGAWREATLQCESDNNGEESASLWLIRMGG